MPETQVRHQATMRQSFEQERAKKAWELVGQLRNDQREDYANRAQAIGPDILTNGLLQTLAVYKSGTKEEPRLVDHLQAWMHSTECSFPWGNLNQQQLIERLCRCDSATYRAAEVEALAFIVWLKRFSKVR
jgi:CRISPR type III-B/RAMP module-associated protein Cmr5